MVVVVVAIVVAAAVVAGAAALQEVVEILGVGGSSSSINSGDIFFGHRKLCRMRWRGLVLVVIMLVLESWCSRSLCNASHVGAVLRCVSVLMLLMMMVVMMIIMTT